MKAFDCPNCGATLAPFQESKFITCAYCGTTIHNEFYQEPEEDEIFLEDVCLDLLKEMGGEMVGNIPGTAFGTPLTGGRLLQEARERFEIPDEDEVFFVCAIGERKDCEQGFALCSSGVHFLDDAGDCGQYTWEEFIDGDVSYEDDLLTIVDSDFTVGEHTSEVGDFLIAFNERAWSEWYEEELPEDEEDEETGEDIDLEALCIERLTEMGERLEHDAWLHFGTPLEKDNQLEKLCATLGVPEDEDVYISYDTTVFGSGKHGLILSDSGLSYKAGGLLGTQGSLTWEEFILGPIRYEMHQPGNAGDNGYLRICDKVTFSILESQSAFARFLVRFHNEVYREYTGERSPREWGIVPKGRGV